MIGILPPVLVVLQLACPVCEIIGLVLGLTFTLHRFMLFVTVSAVIMLVCTIVLCIWKPRESRFSKVCFMLLMPISLLNGLCWFGGVTYPLALLALGNFCCAVVLHYQYAGAWGCLSTVVTFLLGIYVAGICMLLLILACEMPEKTVIAEYHSPEGTYTAQVIVNDGGGRGADTQVDIYDHSRDFDVWIGQFRLPEEKIYSGDWMEYETMVVQWLDDRTLMIDDEIYEMD